MGATTLGEVSSVQGGGICDKCGVGGLLYMESGGIAVREVWGGLL